MFHLIFQSISGSALSTLVKGLPEALQRQYEYEDPIVRSGKHLMHSPFFKVLVALACDLGLDTLPCCAEAHKWAWFRRYCMAARAAASIVKRTALPVGFTEEVMKKIHDIAAESEELTREYETHTVFKQEPDEQLLIWLNRYYVGQLLYLVCNHGLKCLDRKSVYAIDLTFNRQSRI